MTLASFIIDCDTGRDDALAIWIALNLQLPLKAVVSSYGNTSLENVTRNNKRVLHLADTTAALYNGLDAPLNKHIAYKNVVLPRQEISGNGLCNIELPPATESPQPQEISALKEVILAESAEGRPLDYIITGPATNFAALLTESLKNNIGNVTMMGGKFDPLWQELPGADFNIISDPFAVQTILNHGIPIRFVPMNATWPIVMTIEEIKALVPQTNIAEKAQEIMIAHCLNFAPEPVFRFHDPSVIMACLNPDYFKAETVKIITDESSPDFGRIVFDENGNQASIYRPTDQVHQGFLKNMLDSLGFVE